MSNIVPFNEMSQMALAVTKSGMFGLKNENQALTLMMIAQAEGIAPVQAIQMYSIINGMPSLKSTEVQARFQRAGGKVNWKENTNTKASARLEIDGQSYVSEFTIEDAKQMGLASKDNWVKMPKQMLMARAMTMGVRALYPACLNNMYSVDEMQDVAYVESRDTVAYTEAEIEEEPPFALAPEESEMSLKIKLQNKLKAFSFSSADIKAFAEMFELNTNKELLRKLANDAEAVKEYVEKFEGDK